VSRSKHVLQLFNTMWIVSRRIYKHPDSSIVTRGIPIRNSPVATLLAHSTTNARFGSRLLTAANHHSGTEPTHRKCVSVDGSSIKLFILCSWSPPMKFTSKLVTLLQFATSSNISCKRLHVIFNSLTRSNAICLQRLLTPIRGRR